MEKTTSLTVVFFQALRAAASDAYDRLGLTLWNSLVWSIVSLGLAAAVTAAFRTQHALVGVASLFVAMIVLGEVWAACVYLAYRIVTREEPSPSCFLEAWRRMGGKVFWLAMIQTFVTLVILANIAVYLQSQLVLLRVFGVVVVYILLLWLTAMLYQYPLLVEHIFGAYTAEQTKVGWLRRVLRRSLLLTIGNLPFSAGMFALVAVWTVFASFVLVAFVLVYAGMLALAMVHWTRALLTHYGVIQPPPEPEIIPDEQFRIPDE